MQESNNKNSKNVNAMIWSSSNSSSNKTSMTVALFPQQHTTKTTPGAETIMTTTKRPRTSILPDHMRAASHSNTGIVILGHCWPRRVPNCSNEEHPRTKNKSKKKQMAKVVKKKKIHRRNVTSVHKPGQVAGIIMYGRGEQEAAGRTPASHPLHGTAPLDSVQFPSIPAGGGDTTASRCDEDHYQRHRRQPRVIASTITGRTRSCMFMEKKTMMCCTLLPPGGRISSGFRRRVRRQRADSYESILTLD